MIKAIYFKELKELIRDKKTLVFIIALPLFIFPALFGTITFFAAKTVKQEQTRVLSYYIANAEQAPAFVKLFNDESGFKAYQPEQGMTSKADWETLVRSGKVDFVLEVGNVFAKRLSEHQQSEWHLHFNNAELTSSVWRRVNRVIKQYNQQLTSEKLNALGLAQEQHQGLIQPIHLVKVDIAKAKESLGTKLGGMISYILLPLCLMGAMYPAIDLGAGEKEKGTLESLLIAPVTSLELVLGKMLTIMTTSFLSGVMALVSLGLWGFIFAQAMAVEAVSKVVGTLGLVDLGLALIMLIPLILFFSALVLSISIYARSYKEAQNYMAPLSFLVFAPLIIAMLPGINLDWQWAMVPITNIALAIKEILKGGFDWALISFIWLGQLLVSGVLVAFTAIWFRKEAVLFR
ncbi:ABC transporter permease [Saccharobesus litoralis]|uniref:ABC transporter permease n=1 Tax=Saccharobesus litoralis TaxID=2172099 RepID=A0A2S0VUI5_9ALTE|nr:ABC transporter permease [Saccharobesus litoralis]AWB67760.1 ABC transporter permease [Saccharobesus litoralis]